MVFNWFKRLFCVFLDFGVTTPGLNREEKSVFQHKAAPYSLIRAILFKMGADEQLRRCLEKKDRKTIMRALHFGPSGGHFAAITTVNRISSAGY